MIDNCNSISKQLKGTKMKEIENLSIKIQANVQETDVFFVKDEQRLSLKDIIEKTFGIRPYLERDTTCLIDTNEMESYLSNEDTIIKFSRSSLVIRVKMEKEEFKLGTLYKNVNNRLLKVLKEINNHIKQNTLNTKVPFNYEGYHNFYK